VESMNRNFHIGIELPGIPRDSHKVLCCVSSHPDLTSDLLFLWRPRKDSNLRTRFRKPMLYPLSYGGWAQRDVNFSLGAARQVN
jgi:hypothetical protein